MIPWETLAAVLAMGGVLLFGILATLDVQGDDW